MKPLTNELTDGARALEFSRSSAEHTTTNTRTADGSARWGWALLALGLAGVMAVSVFYLLAPPAA